MEKTREELMREAAALASRVAELEKELAKTREELDIQVWGVAKTNDAIKALYKELEKKNQALQELDRMKTDFINTVSHELRTPMTTIREAIAQIQEGLHGPTTETQQEFLLLCLEDVDRLKRIVDNLLDVSRLEAGKFKINREELDVAAIALKVISLFEPKAKGKGVDLKENILSREAVAYADKDSVVRVFNNLIGNALKFTETGTITVSVADKDGFVECAVADTGRGISEDDMQKVFGKFQQFGRTDGPGEKGTGLGLNISKAIVELHRGRIWVDSTLHKGTTFAFTLPKYDFGRLYQEHVTEGLKKAVREKLMFSVLAVGLGDIAPGSSLTRELEKMLKKSVCHGDMILRGERSLVIALPDTDKTKASLIAEKLAGSIKTHCASAKDAAGVSVRFEVVNYPEDGAEKEVSARLSQALAGETGVGEQV